jgi:hypothetical protein
MTVYIAKKLRVSPEDVTIYIEESDEGQNISGGSIFLDRDSLFRILEND